MLDAPLTPHFRLNSEIYTVNRYNLLSISTSISQASLIFPPLNPTSWVN